MGRLAWILQDTAEEGDATARRIVREHGAMLGDYALTAARRVGIEDTPFTVSLAGGVFRHPSTLHSDALAERVREKSPAARITRSRFEPVVGTLFLALESTGKVIDEELVERLAASLPPSGARV